MIETARIQPTNHITRIASALSPLTVAVAVTDRGQILLLHFLSLSRYRRSLSRSPGRRSRGVKKRAALQC